ncbi:unnamed protein product, partial [Ixodes hexagonus]
MSVSLNGELFEDILSERRSRGDLWWCTRQWSCPRYRFHAARTPTQIKQQVLDSARVQTAIDEAGLLGEPVSRAQGRARAEVAEEAHRLLEEMGHNMRMGNIRFLGYLFSKSYKSMYHSIYVCKEGMDRYRRASLENPVLLLPTHRSYNDFLLLSYVCFYYNVPLPVIAAGLDFLGLPAVTMLLRNGGAFFIRRTFGTDRLYWELFREYVHALVSGSEHALEFFVEGTRSRSAKSLCPRTGLLQTALELYFTSRVPDITVIPISITYDRTLEESLYAYELLGVPKPKESTSGLVKARGILSDDYGNIFIKFGNPMSVRSFCGPHIDRSIHSLQPRFETHVSVEESSACARLSRWVVGAHHRCLAMSAFPLACLVLQTRLVGDPTSRPRLQELAREVLWLRDLTQRLGALVHLEGGVSQRDPLSWLRREMRLHSNLVRVAADDAVELVQVPTLGADLGRGKGAPQVRIGGTTVRTALPHVMLCHYGNQALQVLAPACMASLALLLCPMPRSQGQVYENFKRLQSLLQREFVFEEDKLEESFLEVVSSLRGMNLLSPLGWEPLSGDSGSLLRFLAAQLTPFLLGLQLVCSHVLEAGQSEVPLPELVKRCQCLAEERLVSGRLADPRVLSLDLLNNCLVCLCCLGASSREKRWV